jgi:hypothetical protein
MPVARLPVIVQRRYNHPRPGLHSAAIHRLLPRASPSQAGPPSSCTNVMHADPKLFAVLCLVALVVVYVYVAKPENFREHIWAWVLTILIVAALLAITVYVGWFGGRP